MNQKEAKKQIKVFGVASFLNDLGAEMIYPIWPLFLSMFLGAGTAMIGLIDGIGESIVSFSQLFSGYLSDKIRKRKVFIWLGYLFSSISKLGYILASVPAHAIPLRILDRSGKIRDAPRDAIVADVSKHANRGSNFGFLEMMDKAGGVIGIILSILLFQYLGFHWLFFVAAIPPFAAFLLILFAAKEHEDGKIHLYRGLKFKDLGAKFKLFLAISAIFSLSAFSYSFLLLFAKDAGFALAMVPVFYLILNIFASVTAIPFGNLSDRIGRRNSLLIAYSFWVLSTLLFILLSGSFIGLALAFAVYGIHKGAVEPIHKTFVSELAPKKYKASALGVFKMITGICALPASLIAGILWASIGKFAPLYFSLVLSVIAILLLFTMDEKDDSDEE